MLKFYVTSYFINIKGHVKIKKIKEPLTFLLHFPLSKILNNTFLIPILNSTQDL